MPRNTNRPRRYFERLRQRRRERERVLIVCEGETEQRYFEKIRTECRGCDMEISVQSTKNDPLGLVDHALSVFRNNENAFDKIYCVFDKDEHPHFDRAITKAREQNGKLLNDVGSEVYFREIPSVPCFELWILLHFIQVDPKCEIERGEAQRKVNDHIKDYKKGDGDIYSKTKELIETAYRHYVFLKCNADLLKNPYTAVHELVKFFNGARTRAASQR